MIQLKSYIKIRSIKYRNQPFYIHEVLDSFTKFCILLNKEVPDKKYIL